MAPAVDTQLKRLFQTQSITWCGITLVVLPNATALREHGTELTKYLRASLNCNDRLKDLAVSAILARTLIMRTLTTINKPLRTVDTKAGEMPATRPSFIRAHALSSST
jgi:hypothetical protein